MSEQVVLINPYFHFQDPVPKVFPPLGLALLSAQLKELGLSVRVCDGTFSSPEEIIKEVEQLQPAIVGIYAMVTYSRNARRLAEKLRPHLRQTLFIAGGPLPTLYPENFIPPFDLVFRGESDVHFPRFCREYIHRGEGISALEHMELGNYPGLYGPVKKRLFENPVVHQSREILDTLPVPDRTWIDHARYQAVWRGHSGYSCSNIIITRGCPFHCDFCSRPVWGNVFRRPILEPIFQDIRQIMQCGYNQLWIADDSFTLDLGYLQRFCREKVERRLDIAWSCLSRVDRITSDIISGMKLAGCNKVYLGLESGSDHTLKLMNKRNSVADGERAVELYRQGGIDTAGFFIVGYPGESRDDIEKTLALALTLPLDEISFNLPYPLPGSPLYRRVKGLDQKEEWHKANEVRFLYRSEFDSRWLRGRIEETMATFRSRRRSAPSSPGRNSYRVQTEKMPGESCRS